MKFISKIFGFSRAKVLQEAIDNFLISEEKVRAATISGFGRGPAFDDRAEAYRVLRTLASPDVPGAITEESVR